MPQLSLYIDEDTLKKIELAAKIERLSLSKWVSSKLRDVIERSWPEGYGDLFGSITDENFSVPKDEDFSADAERENR